MEQDGISSNPDIFRNFLSCSRPRPVSKHIRNHFLCTTVAQLHISIVHLFPDEMVLDSNVFAHPWNWGFLAKQIADWLSSLAYVAWRFCRAGRRSGVAAKFAREARENERRSREKNKNRLPGFVAFSTAAPFNSFWHPVDSLFGFSFPSQSEIKCWQPKHDTKARDIV